VLFPFISGKTDYNRAEQQNKMGQQQASSRTTDQTTNNIKPTGESS